MPTYFQTSRLHHPKVATSPNAKMYILPSCRGELFHVKVPVTVTSWWMRNLTFTFDPPQSMLPRTRWQHLTGKPRLGLHKMPNPRSDERVAIDQDATVAAVATAKGLARGCCVASSRDCFPQKHWISQWISGASWYEEILIFPQSQEGRKEMLHPDQRERCSVAQAACQITDKKLNKKGQRRNVVMWKLYQCHQLLFFSCWHLQFGVYFLLLQPLMKCFSVSSWRESKNKINLKTIANPQTFSNLWLFWFLLVWKKEKKGLHPLLTRKSLWD